MSAIGSATSATSHANAQLSQQVSTAVAGKVQDAAKAEGEAVIALLSDAASTGPSEPGKGQKIDVHG